LIADIDVGRYKAAVMALLHGKLNERGTANLLLMASFIPTYILLGLIGAVFIMGLAWLMGILTPIKQAEEKA